MPQWVARTHFFTGDDSGKAKRKASTRAEESLEVEGRAQIDGQERPQGPGSEDGYKGHDRPGSLLTVKKQPAKKKVAPKKAAQSPSPEPQPLLSGPRKVEVRAVRLGEYGGKYRAPNEVFTMEVDGELPYWVTKVGSD